MLWVVGDVHGCAKALDRLLREIDFDAGRDELWSVGDLVNTGPDSAAVVRLWRELGGRAVLGNHDVYALRSHAGDRKRKRRDSLDDLFSAPDSKKLLAWMRDQPLMARLQGRKKGRFAWLVHAGLLPSWRNLKKTKAMLAAALAEHGMDSAETRAVTTLRCCDESGQQSAHKGMVKDCPPGFSPWDDFYRGDDWILHGHWAMRGHYRARRSIGLDSGCVYGGPLTAWCLEEDRIVQVRGGGRS